MIPFVGICQTTPPSSNEIMETIIPSGSSATGSSGTVTYSIGQVFYTYIGVESVYNVAQGIQHQEKDSSLDTPDIEKPTTQIVAFPNPTIDYVNISMTGLELEGQKSYKLYDIQGRLLKQNVINQTEAQVSFNYLSPSIYILVVYNNSQILKSFKIIKN
ncbi:T9SS type A sorting domain-containing protein [Flavobacterium crocinum]|uniref:T9SS type A sorting domain-containing protein n=1 Tax=Flavobacterium crocinum TaxID=2183896 RepID=UPI00197AB079|nr:T9SS type A sorting domain-containing protein [Flavobacterium crocinum]